MGIVLLILVFLFFMFGDIKSSRIDSDISATSHLKLTQLLAAVGYWALLFIVFSVFRIPLVLPLYLSLPLFIFAASPSTLAKISANAAMVSLSYRLGCKSLIRYKRNPHAAGLFFGFIAVRKLKNSEQKKQQLQWLREQFVNHKTAIYSGDIILYTLIESQLSHPDDFDHLASELKKLSGLGSRSIPKAISRYAFKCAIVAALADSDWDELYSIACQWDGRAKNRLARYVKYFYLARVKKEAGSAIRFKCFYYWLFCLTEPALRRLPAQYRKSLNTTQTPSDDISLHSLITANSLTQQQNEKLTSALFSEQQKLQWQQRAEQLGSWDTQTSWDSIQQSVQRLLIKKTQDSASQPQQSEQDYEQIDRTYKSLLYLTRNINSQLEDKTLKGSASSFLEFKKVLKLLEELSTDKQAYFAAIHNIDGILWNWIAHLWNKKKDQSLVHFMCMNCIPLANSIGNQRFLDIINEIICD
ncbi:hypothetical protein [Reinekea thalattae]|uniref:Uncharacterized protein n=1 Tax=Reinekea thalattae TaxID=2593301 RepID=A0A5C8Z386_9GAMM|nr:hypothetical protein [Reinekea thalattae]TXR51390.1 hypothetical protein FME95_12740 [Reinekea thalattae]